MINKENKALLLSDTRLNNPLFYWYNAYYGYHKHFIETMVHVM